MSHIPQEIRAEYKKIIKPGNMRMWAEVEKRKADEREGTANLLITVRISRICTAEPNHLPFPCLQN